MNQLHPVHQTHDGFFNTVSGKRINIHNPTVDMIDINDIAHALSNICRFGGHVKEFYSVAQHSLLVYYLAPIDLRTCFAALMHDATEAYCHDVIKPLKNILGKPYEEIEKRFEAVICERFEIDAKDFTTIKPYDKQALEIEHGYFWKGDLSLIRCFGTERTCWPPDIAKEMFLGQFHDLKY